MSDRVPGTSIYRFPTSDSYLIQAPRGAHEALSSRGPLALPAPSRRLKHLFVAFEGSGSPPIFAHNFAHPRARVERATPVVSPVNQHARILLPCASLCLPSWAGGCSREERIRCPFRGGRAAAFAPLRHDAPWRGSSPSLPDCVLQTSSRERRRLCPHGSRRNVKTSRANVSRHMLPERPKRVIVYHTLSPHPASVPGPVCKNAPPLRRRILFFPFPAPNPGELWKGASPSVRRAAALRSTTPSLESNIAYCIAQHALPFVVRASIPSRVPSERAVMRGTRWEESNGSTSAMHRASRLHPKQHASASMREQLYPSTLSPSGTW